MNDNLREELRSEIEDFRTQTKRFLDKELNVKEFMSSIRNVRMLFWAVWEDRPV